MSETTEPSGQVVVTEAMVEAAWQELRARGFRDGQFFVDCIDRDDVRSALFAALALVDADEPVSNAYTLPTPAPAEAGEKINALLDDLTDAMLAREDSCHSLTSPHKRDNAISQWHDAVSAIHAALTAERDAAVQRLADAQDTLSLSRHTEHDV